jgi:YidC/Oxa1 family membrane protein insertase
MKDGTDLQRTVLWVIFGMALFMLWDKWQVHNGRAGLFMPAPVATSAPAATPSTATPAASTPAATPAANQAANQSANRAATASIPSGVPAATPAPATTAQPPSAAVPPPSATSPRVKVDTDVLSVEIDSQGAVLSRAELLTQQVAPDWTGSGLPALVTGRRQDKDVHVVLLEVSPARVYVAQSGLIGAENLPTHRSAFTVDGALERRLESGQDTVEVRLTSESGGVRLNKTYVFRRGSHAVEVRHGLENLGAAALNPALYLQITRDGNKPEGESALYYTYTGAAMYSDADKFRKFSFDEIKERKTVPVRSANDGWVAMIQHYFVTAWVPGRDLAREFYALNPDSNLYSVGTKLALGELAPGAKLEKSSTLFVGPQDQKALEAIAPGLELVVDYGWLTVISKPLFWLLQLFHGLVGNWGWAIVLLTVLIKLVFYPLSAASYRSMAKMKEVTPRLMKLREQYGDDKQKLNLAMMELYKTEKINPLGGCLPILVQIPVFIALYWVLLASVEMRNQPWMLWVHDLATPDPWFILPVLMMATMWAQYKLNPTPPDPIQTKVMAAMPFIFGIMFFLFPAGLVLYWLVNNCLSIAQQWYITRQIAQAKKVG